MSKGTRVVNLDKMLTDKYFNDIKYVNDVSGKMAKKKKLFLKFTRPKVCKVKETSEIIALLIFSL